jgi:hypothetical protein
VIFSEVPVVAGEVAMATLMLFSPKGFAGRSGENLRGAPSNRVRLFLIKKKRLSIYIVCCRLKYFSFPAARAKTSVLTRVRK